MSLNLLIPFLAFIRMTQIHLVPGVDRMPQVGVTKMIILGRTKKEWIKDEWIIEIFFFTFHFSILQKPALYWNVIINLFIYNISFMTQFKAIVSQTVSLIILRFLLCPLDGAKKPWDRANSADRSMGSRWELQAAQLVAGKTELFR